MVAINHDGLAIPGRVDLAHEPPFSLAGLSVDPGTRQVSGVGMSQTLEPKVMQVLVALARARGAIVSRDELIQFCWSGRIVGDDSINRVLARIRGVASGIGKNAFRVETITKVGYRLLEEQATPFGDAAEARPSSAKEARPAIDHSRRILIGGAVFAAIAVGAAGWRQLVTPGFEPKPEAIALYQMGIGARSQGLVATSDQAESYFRQAVRADPDYADAWGALARQLAAQLRGQSERTIEGAHFEVRSAARRALALDPRQIEALGSLATIDPQYRRWRQFEQRVLQFNEEHPRYNPAKEALAELYANVGRWNQAIAFLQEARTTSPLMPKLSNLLTIALWSAGRTEEAESESVKGMERWPRFHGMWFTRMLLLTYGGKPERALAFAANREIWPMGALAEDIIQIESPSLEHLPAATLVSSQTPNQPF